MKHVSILIISTVLFMSGCTEETEREQNKENNNITEISTKTLFSQNVSNVSKRLLIKESEVSDVKAVNSDNEIIIDAQIKQMDRFQLENIEKRLKKLVEEKHPNYKVILSTDQKIFLELDELEQKIINSKLSDKELKEELKKIKNLSKEQT